MSKCTKVRTLALLAMNVCIAAPLLAHAQPTSEVEISCDAGDSLQAALAALAPGGRIVIRSGTCTGNLSLSRDVRIQGAGYDLVTIKAADASLPVVTVPRGVTATISGVSISGGRVGLWNAGRVSLSFSRVSENTSGGIEIRDRGSLEGDKIKVVRNMGPGITILGAEATLRGSVIAQNVTGGEGGGGMLIVGGRAELVGTQIEDNEAIRDGGGLLATGKGLLVLDRVRLFRNKARTGHGGAIAVNASTAEISGSSLFENLADAGNGGGIAVLSAGEVRLTNTTVASNVASFHSADTGRLGWRLIRGQVVQSARGPRDHRPEFGAGRGGHRFQQHGDDALVPDVGQLQRVGRWRVRGHRADRVEGLESADPARRVSIHPPAR